MTNEGVSSQEGLRPCPACRTPIVLGATRCRYCGYSIQHYVGDFRKVSADALFSGQYRQFAARNLSEAASRGELSPIFERKTEMEQVLGLLFDGYGRNILIVGNEGTGKTCFVEAVALAAHQHTKQTGEPCQIIEFNTALLENVAVQVIDNIKYMLDLHLESPEMIIFFDNMLPVLQAAPGTKTPAGLLASRLAEQTLHCIGTVRLNDFARLQKDKGAVLQHFETIQLAPLSEAGTFELLKQRRVTLQKRFTVEVGDEALKAAISMTNQYIPKQDLPGKAVTILEQACRRYRNKLDSKRSLPAEWLDNHTMKHLGARVGPHDVKRAITEVTSIDIDAIEADEWRKTLEQRLTKLVIGQDTAMEALAEMATRIRLRFGEGHSVSGLLLLGGPVGVGKVYSARILTTQLLGSVEDLTILNMRTYSQDDAGSRLLGFDSNGRGSLLDGDLAKAVRDTPIAMVIFDGIEQAHPTVFEALLPILQTGVLRDAFGNELNFRKCIFIFTFNCAPPKLSESHTPSSLRQLLFGTVPSDVAEHIQAFIPYKPLKPLDIRGIIRRKLEDFYRELKPMQVSMRLHDQAYQFLIQRCDGGSIGVNNLPVIIDEMIVFPIRRMVQGKKIQAGDVLELRQKEDRIAIHLLTQRELE